MTWAEFKEWQLFHQVSPFGPWRDDYRMSRLYTWWAQANGAKGTKFTDVLEALSTFRTDVDTQKGKTRRFIDRFVSAVRGSGVPIIHRKHSDKKD